MNELYNCLYTHAALSYSHKYTTMAALAISLSLGLLVSLLERPTLKCASTSSSTFCFLRRRNEKLQLIFSQPPRLSGGLVCASVSAERSSRSDSSANVKEGGREQKRFNGSDSCATSLPGRNHAVLEMHRNLRQASCSTATVGEGCIKVRCVKEISSSVLLRK